MVISETWLDDNMSLTVEGYNCITKNRKNKKGGGIAIICRKKYQL